MFTTRTAARLPRVFTQVRFASSTYKTNPFKVYKCEAPAAEITVDNQEVINHFRDMNVIRLLEHQCKKAYQTKLIQGFLHLYDGQEGVCVGMEAALVRDDHVITAYREHGWAYTRGCTPRAIFGELMGKANGTSKGKGGSMHMYSAAGNFYGGNGIVGAQVPVGAGVAFSQKYNNTGNVCVALYGDGAANQGQIFEAFNMSSLWKLPIIYVCENNKYGMGTSVKRASANDQFYLRGDYIPGIQIDAMDYFTVRAATEYARKYVLEHGPIVLEMLTYRYMGHSMSDPGITYRNADEVKKVKESQDPIDQLAKKLIDAGAATAEELEAVRKQAQKIVDEDWQLSNKDPFPELEETYTHIFTEDVPVRGVAFGTGYKVAK